jgi:hypothetical protein
MEIAKALWQLSYAMLIFACYLLFMVFVAPFGFGFAAFVNAGEILQRLAGIEVLKNGMLSSRSSISGQVVAGLNVALRALGRGWKDSREPRQGAPRRPEKACPFSISMRRIHGSAVGSIPYLLPSRDHAAAAAAFRNRGIPTRPNVFLACRNSLARHNGQDHERHRHHRPSVRQASCRADSNTHLARTQF